MGDHRHHHSHDPHHGHHDDRPQGSGYAVGEGGPSRRSVLGVAAGSMLFMAAAPGTAQAATTGTAAANGVAALAAGGASRTSLITSGTTLVHADLHNHTTMSDGDGDPALAFASMRSAGLDVAALTDHSGVFTIGGLSSSEWKRTADLANAANVPGVYTAIRGFEWTHAILGHSNVWFSDSYVDMSLAPSMSAYFNWLDDKDAIAGFNHPGRESGRFNNFAYNSAVRDRMVSLEMFNRGDDYLFEGWSSGASSPLVACLNAGWRTGLTGVTDEHGTDWGFPEGKGRSGLWVTENTRAGVLAAMRARRFFATRVSGLRLDATANGVRMGGDVPVTAGDVRFAVDLDRGAEWIGKTLNIQVLRPGTSAPTVVDVIPTTAGRVTEFTVPMNSADGNWVVLRVSDPTQANASPGPAGHPCNDWGVAYSSPWWLQG